MQEADVHRLALSYFVGRPVDQILRALHEHLEQCIDDCSMGAHIGSIVEAVGGAIAVEVISKGDGFIWPKRERCFEADGNPQLFARYG